MNNLPAVFEKLKALSKNDDSFNELVSLFSDYIQETPSEEVNIFKQDGNKCQFEGYFWTRFNPEDLSKINYSDSVKIITGYSKEDLLSIPGKHLSIIHPDDFEKIKRKYTDIMMGLSDSSLRLQYRIISKSNKLVWINETFHVFKDKDDKVLYCESLAHDISEFMLRQTELDSTNNNLKSVLDERDKFINIISHDLRSPFTSLLGFSEILIHEPNLPINERQEYLEYIHDASQTQLQFINHLLDWSRLKTGKIKIEPKRLPLKDIISNQVSLATRVAIEKNLDIIVELDGEIFVSVDERLIGDAIGNLLKNAIKFSEENRSIYIKVNKFKEGMVELIVKDEGIGITEENQSKLFRIDQKYVSRGTRDEKGCGMGLNLVKEIVEKHNGEVWFYSKVGEGSEFHFTVPEAQNIILIVEDDNEVRQLYKKIIDSCHINFRVREAGNGYEAMSNIFVEMPSLVITDHDMPLMNGIQLVEAVRRRDKRFLIPIIVISAKFDDEIMDKYKQYGVEHLIPKPFDTIELGNIIKQLLQ